MTRLVLGAAKAKAAAKAAASQPERVCDDCMLGGGAGAGASILTRSPRAGKSGLSVDALNNGIELGRVGGSQNFLAYSEQDALLAAIFLNVGRLGEIGKGMGAELTAQDKALDELTESVEHAGLGLKKNIKVATKITKS